MTRGTRKKQKFDSLVHVWRPETGGALYKTEVKIYMKNNPIVLTGTEIPTHGCIFHSDLPGM